MQENNKKQYIVQGCGLAIDLAQFIRRLILLGVVICSLRGFQGTTIFCVCLAISYTVLAFLEFLVSSIARTVKNSMLDDWKEAAIAEFHRQLQEANHDKVS